MVADDLPRARKRHLVFAVLVLSSLSLSQAGESTLVYPGAAGRLLHVSRALGDRVPDFSSAGYQYGQQQIPAVGSAIVVQPGPGDDTGRIQAAINSVSTLPPDPLGFRGAVLLDTGEFQIDSSLLMWASGVVLRGTGNSDSGTVLRGTGTGQRTIINVRSGGSLSKIASSEQSIIDKYVPVGATSFRVSDPSGFQVGDPVIVFRPSTANWISALGMDMIPPRPDGGPVQQWTPGSKDLKSDRIITRIEGDRVFINAPITNSLDVQYGGGSIYKYSFANRLQNIGIEELKGVSDYNPTNPFDEDHPWTFISIDDTEHAWVRNVTAQYFGKNAVSIEREGKNVTIRNVHNIDPISQITGGRRYAFEVDGQLNLVRDSSSDSGRHDFILNSPSPGPNVFLDSIGTNALDESGPHQRWSTGGLFDNITVQGDQINVRNRGNFGTGHGWAGANMVIWNSNADSYIVQNPPTAQNWLIGSVGQIIEDRQFGVQEPGIVDHHGQHVDTRSLYLKQIADRLEVADGQRREYVTGDYDEFVYDGSASVDHPFVSQNLQMEFASLLNQGLPTHGFDDMSGPSVVPFSWNYQLDSDEQVYHAVLSLAMRKTSGQTRDDSLWYERIANELNFTFDLGLTQELSSTDNHVLVLEFVGTDLADFHDGEFNVVLANDVGLDWSRLELYVGPRLIGDFDYNGVLDGSDIDQLCANIGGNDLNFDLNADGQITSADVEQLVLSEIGTLFGDANLDSIVDGEDFNIWNQHKFSAPTGWHRGDFNCDGATGGGDFNVWNQNKFQSAGPASVPEPTGWCVAAVVLCAAWRLRAHRSICE